MADKEIQTCLRATDPFYSTYASLWSDVNFARNYRSSNELAQALRNESCKAIIAPNSYIDNWATDAKYCSFRVRDLVLTASAGWVTEQGNLCVQRSVEAALQALLIEGRVTQLMRKWLPPAECLAEEETTIGDTNATPIDITHFMLLFLAFGLCARARPLPHPQPFLPGRFFTHAMRLPTTSSRLTRDRRAPRRAASADTPPSSSSS